MSDRAIGLFRSSAATGLAASSMAALIGAGLIVAVAGCGAKTDLDRGPAPGIADAGVDPMRCQTEVRTAPLRPTTVMAPTVTGATARSWTLSDKPPGSALRLTEPATGASIEVTPDVAGEYELTVLTETPRGEVSCLVRLFAVPSEGLRIEISWNGPPDRSCDLVRAPCDPTDVDLHLVRETGRFFDLDDDCHWQNCQADGRALPWGAPGAVDDPRLDIDDQEGFGPENINIDGPVPGTYRVGVDLWDGDGAPEAEVTVRIFCGSGRLEPVEVFGPVVLREHLIGMRGDNDFWRVADVTTMPSGCRVAALGTPARPDLISHDDAASGR